MSTTYHPKKGTEAYVHVQVTKKNGVPVSPDAEPELYHPVAYAQVANLQGFAGTILHDPRKAGQKQASAPQVDTVQAADKLETESDYRARYRVLFREDAPFNASLQEVKRIVDNAEKKLAEGPEGVAPVDESDEAHAARIASEAAAKASKAPTDKAGWLALYRAAHPDDTTEDNALTVAAIREKLGK